MRFAKERVPLASTRLRKRERRMKRGREAREKRYSTETQTTEMLQCWFLKYGDFMEISWDPSVRCVQSWGRLQPRKWIKPRLKFGSLAARLSPCQKSPTGVRPVSDRCPVNLMSILCDTLILSLCHYYISMDVTTLMSSISKNLWAWLSVWLPTAVLETCIFHALRLAAITAWWAYTETSAFSTAWWSTFTNRLCEMNLLLTPSLCWQHLAVQIAGVHVVHALWFVWIWSKKFTTTEASPARLNFCLNGSFLQPTKGTLTSLKSKQVNAFAQWTSISESNPCGYWRNLHQFPLAAPGLLEQDRLVAPHDLTKCLPPESFLNTGCYIGLSGYPIEPCLHSACAFQPIRDKTGIRDDESKQALKSIEKHWKTIDKTRRIYNSCNEGPHRRVSFSSLLSETMTVLLLEVDFRDEHHLLQIPGVSTSHR